MHVQNNAEKPVNPADAGVALQPKPAENREPAPKRDEAPAIPGAATDLTFCNLVVMKDSFETGMRMLSDMARYPAFAQNELERQRQ